MAIRKQAFLMFSKAPIPGTVKTRLTTANGGFLTEQQAADFFKLSLLDVCEASMQALQQLQAEKDAARAADPTADEFRYDFFLSTTPASSLPLMEDLFEKTGPWPMEIHFMTDSGATFDDHFDDAFKQIFDQGYESIVSISGDIPTLAKSHLTQAYQWLEYFKDSGTPGFVCAPCQECGTSLVGASYDTPINHQGVYYNLDGVPALDAYMEKVRANDIPVAYFAPIPDVDDKTDLAHAISCMHAIEQAGKYQPDIFVPRRTLSWVGLMGIQVSTPPNDEHDPRQYIDAE